MVQPRDILPALFLLGCAGTICRPSTLFYVVVQLTASGRLLVLTPSPPGRPVKQVHWLLLISLVCELCVKYSSCCSCCSSWFPTSRCPSRDKPESELSAIVTCNYIKYDASIDIPVFRHGHCELNCTRSLCFSSI